MIVYEKYIQILIYGLYEGLALRNIEAKEVKEKRDIC